MISLKQKGFTLVEVLIAMAILAIGLLALSSIQSNSALHNKTAREVTQAVFLAQQQLEMCMNTDFDDIINYNGTVDEYTVVRSVNATGSDTKEIHLIVRHQNSQHEFNLIRSNSY